jgi:hypothetical protein
MKCLHNEEKDGASCCATMLLEVAHMKKNCARKSARGGRALLTGLMRCGRCGRMMRVFYGSAKGNAHRYRAVAIDAHVGAGPCSGIGGFEPIE